METTTIPPIRQTNPPLRHLLDPYTTSHPLRSPSPLPPSSRVNPKLKQRLPPKTSSSPLLWTIPTWIAFARFATAKGIYILWSLVKHALFGPMRKSWGYRMTFITSFMRNVADHTSLADIVLIRRLISLHALLPLPSDAVVTPITFLVPRHLGDQVARGFLRELDLNETGHRELSGEWVVGTEVWQRLKAERRARSSFRNRVTSNPTIKDDRGREGREGRGEVRDDPNVDSELEPNKYGERVIYFLHGGAYYVGSATSHRVLTIGVSKACNARVFALTYRLAPEHVFPLPLHDVLHGYLRLLSPPLNIPPENIIIAGDSAGGGLTLALCMYLRDEGYKLPAGIVLMSPWVDLTMSCGSWDENSNLDVVPRPEADDHLNPVGCYLGPKGLKKYLTHPYASPLFGDFHNLPPMLIQSGDSEVLRDEITLLAHKASLSGVEVTHELYQDMIHVFQMFRFLPSSKSALNSIGNWVQITLPKIQKRHSKVIPGSGEGIEREVRLGEREVDEIGEDMNIHLGQTEVMMDELERQEDLESWRRSEFDQDPPPYSPTRVQTQPSQISQSQSQPSLIAPSRTTNVPSNSAVNQPTTQETYARGRRPSVGLGLNVSSSLPEQINIDEDEDDSSGSPTPTRSRTPTIEFPSVPPPHTPEINIPKLRRSLTEYESSLGISSEIRHRSHGSSTSLHISPIQVSSIRHHDPSLTSVNPSISSAHPSSSSTHPPHTSAQSSSHRIPKQQRSGPTSPTSSIKRLRSPTINLGIFGRRTSISSPTPSVRRLRSPTVSGSREGRKEQPTTRERSMSHSDIFNLVEGYQESGAANETVVYAPGGEVKSVGVLGED
ncbi:hypothetical protein TREMEDRAFT_71836 [Tremella mesenterica DSM 1558]|uniref:uncharacterized protein n=1 Tax=Tremella mesenterica (strain ATCC 24925 / CBS 8224 / DSM 1558 / NBRC 9311 / NRRL Y-6157 / RJB 2259-6 / UBC 559-6) TaxID=578456 RepID=UPI0003F4967E|nr:uncharacterized protein TREMEDRAFT_71836 [Tremella mesenterica DSM 1558]EIW68552.1 hypothetical protein TREMEDRAFT_71836 [Tremella mesenterica DSM 1558]